MKLAALALAATTAMTYTVDYVPDTNIPLDGQQQEWLCRITPTDKAGEKFFARLSTHREELRAELLDRFKNVKGDIIALDKDIATANKFGQSTDADEALNRRANELATVIAAEGFKPSELSFFLSSIPPVSTTIPLGGVYDVTVGATYSAADLDYVTAADLGEEFSAALTQESFLVPEDSSEALKSFAAGFQDSASDLRFSENNYAAALRTCRAGIEKRRGTSAGSVVREPAGVEFRPIEIAGIVIGAVALTGIAAWLYTIAKDFDFRRILP